MKQKLLLIAVTLLCAVGSWAYTGVEPAAGRTYFLYNVGANAYFVGTSGSYGTDGNIANATPVTVETSGSNFKLAFVYGGTTYRIYHDNGTPDYDNTSGVEFWKTGSASAYKLVSKHSDKNRYMDNGGWFGSNSGDNNTSWQFIACEEAMTHMSTFCAGVAEANYVQSAKGWERVTSISELQTNPEDYFFAIFSANAVGLIVDASSDNAEPSRPYYKTATDPLSSSQYLFEIENYLTDGFALKSCGLNNYFGNNTDSWIFQNLSEKEANCKLTITLNDGAYRIQSANADWEGRRYWGLYNYTGYTNGQKFAGNKNDAEKGSFLIYRIAKENLSLTDRMNIDRANWEGDTNTYLSVAVESYNGNDTPFATGDVLTQTISNLPNGIYEVEFYAWENFAPWNASADIASGDNIAQVIANEAAYDINVLKAINDREWNTANTYTLYCSVTDGTLKYGVKNIASGGNWAVCRPISLTYLISSLPASLTGVSGHMNASVAAAQATAIAAYNAVDGQTPSNYAAAIDAIANAEASIAAYAKAATYLSSVEAVLATTNFYTPTAYSSVYGTYKTAYDAGTLDDATAAGLTYKVASHTPSDQRYTDNTANDLLIHGWTFGGNDASTSGSGFYINSWSTESDGSGDAADFANPFYEYWTDNNAVLSAKTISGTISGLTPNAPYSVTANVRVRQTDNQTKVAGSVTMQVGSGSTVDVTAGKQIGSTPRYIKSYTAVGNADSDGKLTLTFTVAGSSNISWLAFRDVNYTRLADDDDYTALNSAITTAEAKTLGFETGEYAPYNNIAALTALAAAQAINQEADNTQASVNNTTTTLSGATWTANAEDVECVYNGDFALADDGGWDRLAWTRSSNWGASIPDNYGSTDISTMQTAGASTGHAYYNQPGSMQYGNTGLYTMPLSANTIYQLSFKYASESENSNESVTASVLNSGDGMAAKVYGANTVAYKTADAFVTKTIKFVTGAAGNYVLTLANSGNTVITDVSITKAASQTLTFNEGGTTPAFAAGTYPTVALDRSFNTSNYSTLCLPFAMDADRTSAAFSEVYAFDAVEGSSLKFVTASSITAGTPYLVKAKNSTLSVNNVEVDPSTTTLDVEKTDGISTVTFKGVFSPIGALPTDGSRYVVSSNKLYQVNSAVGLDGYRAYFISEATSSAKSFVLNFDNTTVINAVEAAQTENAVIYNLAGQRLSKAQKGINIINGKKVLVK